MVFGTVDEIQKIHVRSIPMGESVLRISYQKSTGTYGVCSTRVESKKKTDRIFASKSASVTSHSKPKSILTDFFPVFIIFPSATMINSASRNESGDGAPKTVSSFMVLDQNTFQVLHAHEFGQWETAVRQVPEREMS